MKDPYLYDDCQVLRNKLGIKDTDLLDKAEVELSCNAINDLLTSSIQGDYNFDHLCDFHKRIFRQTQTMSIVLGGLNVELHNIYRRQRHNT